MPQFAFLIGKCTWAAPSAKAAVMAVMYWFGIGAMSPSFVADFHTGLAEQYVAAGKTPAQALAEVKHFDACVATYVIRAEKR